ncbi:autophagy-related 13 [Chlorella sorokiniana]|uniref:Autophagy-related 13 n=1 Tax=Chlorella sorokiniana TaxID=3076 RepID=A0A2P6TVT3_CHLSO|nr:autophagy-related 13 [Chlorella sorokiniana]|eukprot:PRW58175.1 autophagy-related 13 [Chlorella sorokiniana]
MGSSSGPSVERVIAEAYVKAAEVVLDARIVGSGRRAPPQPQKRAWFNLEVPEVEPAATTALERWRREAGLPLVLEIFLQPWGAQAAASAGGEQDRVETLLERWVVHYYPQLPEGAGGAPHLSRSQLARLSPSTVYKRLVITLRSLFTYLRVLPAYRMYRACKRQRGANFTLGYRLHSTLPGRAGSAGGSRRLQSFRFGGVDTPYGQFRISVDYQPASTVTILEQTTSPPPLPQIIADYLGGSGSSGSGDGGGPPLRHAMSASVFTGPAGPALSPRQASVLPLPLSSSPSGALQHAQQVQPGSSPAAGGGRLIRRSWSTSLRASQSPYRGLLSQSPSSELPSPVSARGEAPYGSAPQPVSLPAMLRQLSSSASKFAVGSPSGRPPLAKPPRTAVPISAPMAAPPGRPTASGAPLPSDSGSAGRGSLLASAAAAEDREDGSHGSGSLPGSSRQCSAPMCIPGRGTLECGSGAGQGRRLRSSNDLWALQQAAAMRKPLSAPVVSHMRHAAGSGQAAAAEGSTQVAGQRGASGAEAPPSPSPPAARLPLIPGTLDSESSGSAASSLYPTSCSPQLPFAFTPSAQSVSSFGARGPLESVARLERTSPRTGHLRTPSSGGGGGGAASMPHQAAAAALAAQQAAQRGAAGAHGAAATSGSAGSGGTSGFSPSSGGSVSGREVPTSTALMRRPSWSSRSYGPLAGEASSQGVGYSVSPMADPSLDSILAGSTPRQFTLAAGLPPPLAMAAGTHGPAAGAHLLSRVSSTVSACSAAAPPMLEYPAASADMGGGGGDEADVLPFALDEGAASPVKPRSPAPGAASEAAPGAELLPVSTAAGGAPAGRVVSPTGPAPAVDTDAAVGAFVRLIQEAPPLRLHNSRPPTRPGSADFAAGRAGGAGPGTSSGSDSSGATCLSDGRGLTLQAGLRQFSRIKERLRQKGIMLGPCPAEA